MYCSVNAYQGHGIIVCGSRGVTTLHNAKCYPMEFNFNKVYKNDSAITKDRWEIISTSRLMQIQAKSPRVLWYDQFNLGYSDLFSSYSKL